MDRLGRFIERRRWLVLGAWIVVLLAAAPFAAGGLRQPARRHDPHPHRGQAQDRGGRAAPLGAQGAELAEVRRLPGVVGHAAVQAEAERGGQEVPVDPNHLPDAFEPRLSEADDKDLPAETVATLLEERQATLKRGDPMTDELRGKILKTRFDLAQKRLGECPFTHPVWWAAFQCMGS